MPPETTTDNLPPNSEVSDRITAVGRQLADAFEHLVDALPGHAQKPQALARMLDIDKNVSHRLVTAIRKGDPLAAAHTMPGPEALRRVAESARKKRVPAMLADRADEAIRAFESLIINEAGDRSSLDALISTWLPDARERYERSAKQAAFRGARQIKGLSCDVFLTTAITYPADDHEGCNTALITGYYGLRRIRPEASLGFNGLFSADHPNAWIGNLDRVQEHRPDDFVWRKYCSPQDLDIMLHKIPGGGNYAYEVKWNDVVGPRSDRDIVLREYIYRSMRRVCAPGDPNVKTGVAECMVVPARKMVFDLLLPTEIYPDCNPQVRVVQMGGRGFANPNDRSRDFDVLPLVERFESLGQGIKRFRAEEIPAYVDMLSEACHILNWDPDTFRCFRARIDYPPFGTEVQAILDLPVDQSVPGGESKV